MVTNTASSAKAQEAEGPTSTFFLNRASDWIDYTLSKSFYYLGHQIAERPALFAIIPAVLMILFFIPVMLGIDTETDPEDLYTPQDSIAFSQRIVVEEQFGFRNATNRMFLQRRDGLNILDTANSLQQNKDGLLALLEALESLLQVSVAGVTLENRCARVFLTDDGTLKSGCDITSPLTLFSNSSDPNQIRAAIESSLDIMQDIEDALNATTRNAVFRTIVKSDIFGGFTPATGNDDSTVTSVQTLALDFVLVNLERREDSDLVEDTARADFEIAASTAVRSLSSSTFFYAALFSGDVEEEADAAIDADVGLLAPGYILLLAYSTFVLWRNNWVHSYSAMATVSMACVGLAILGMWGFAYLIGTTYTLTVQAAFFLVLGLGVDDTFVIMAAHRDVSRGFAPRERIARTLGRAGVSITITSLTNTIAFATGTLTALPAIEYFCVYSLFGVLFDFLLQVTTFVSFLYWNTEREQAQRADWLVWWKPKEPERACLRNEPFDVDGNCLLDRIMGDYLPRVLLHPVGKVTVLALALTLAGVSAWGSTQGTTRFDQNWFIPDDSHVQSALDIQDSQFGGQSLGFSYYTGGLASDGSTLFVNYTSLDTQEALDNLLADTLANRDVRDCDNAWWSSFREYFESTSEASATVEVDGVIYLRPEAFYAELDAFVGSVGRRFSDRLLRANDTDGTLMLTDLACDFFDVFARDTQVDSMNAVRDIVGKYSAELGGGQTFGTSRGTVTMPFAYDFVFLFFDGLAVIRQETLRNVLIAGVAVGLVTLVLLANVLASLSVLLMLVLVDVNVLGFMYFVGIDFNSVSAVNLVIAVGLAIDSSVHIAHAFLNSHGTRDERAAMALKKLGRSAVNGALSTFLAVVLLAAAVSYIFQVFFALISLIILFAIFHGAIVLPVVLSLVGPPPHPPAENFEAKLPAHPDEKPTAVRTAACEAVPAAPSATTAMAFV